MLLWRLIDFESDMASDTAFLPNSHPNTFIVSNSKETLTLLPPRKRGHCLLSTELNPMSYFKGKSRSKREKIY